ncbi:unnamed protein product [Owenia fusiformis]|uniref:EGF-like domain-containing protein n=1 Tax=Owenia fusiformis TaxID=6347 RepID=A0A8S4PEI2_OWEFU|nr:unnamed protein product [Owenia fusiformis]
MHIIRFLSELFVVTIAAGLVGATPEHQEKRDGTYNTFIKKGLRQLLYMMQKQEAEIQKQEAMNQWRFKQSRRGANNRVVIDNDNLDNAPRVTAKPIQGPVHIKVVDRHTNEFIKDHLIPLVNDKLSKSPQQHAKHRRHRTAKLHHHQSSDANRSEHMEGSGEGESQLARNQRDYDKITRTEPENDHNDATKPRIDKRHGVEKPKPTKRPAFLSEHLKLCEKADEKYCFNEGVCVIVGKLKTKSCYCPLGYTGIQIKNVVRYEGDKLLTGKQLDTVI